VTGLPLGWRTDLAVLRLSGSLVEERADHLVVRSPANPSYHWGNLLVVTDPGAVDDPVRWRDAFRAAFPDAAHLSLGLVVAPRDPGAWLEHGLEVEQDAVLAADAPPAPTDLAAGYTVRAMSGTDWERSTDLRVLTWGQEGAGFERASTAARRRMVEAGHTQWFGAFAGDELAAELGIVDLGDGLARYQSVVTAPDHRRRGLTRHLLAEAGAWAAGRGARRWVIVADAGGDAERLYLAAGFEAVDTSVKASPPG
jgi:GNAT superfamily N-acetyltransferase